MTISAQNTKIHITDQDKSNLNDLTAYYRQLLSQQSDPSSYNRINQEDLLVLAQDWNKLDHETKGLLIWALNMVL